MTYPTEFRTQKKVIGSNAIKHPIYTFSVNLDRFKNEAFGPNTNQTNVHVLPADQYQSSPNLGNSQNAVRDLQNVSWLPGFLGAENIDINDDGTITAYGAKGTYLKNTYTVGLNPLLTLVNSPPYTTP